MNQPATSGPTATRTPVVTLRKKPATLISGFRSAAGAIASDAFIAAMRGAAAGVNIVTTDGTAGRWGVTVSAFSSVSAEPPSVLVCVNRQSPVCAAILENGNFCVNVLSTGQRGLADTFAGFPAEGDAYDFCRAAWTRATSGAPRLAGCVASFDCGVNSAMDVGTHTIFIGVVRSAESGDADPLLYTNRTYRRACGDA